jgi:protocatechuate 3,4-dioxygenase beta subunit
MRGVILCIGLLSGLSSFVNANDKSKLDCILCGHITDSTTGQAVTDATIELYGGPISQVEADANGFYCFEKISKQGNYRIGIDSNEYVGLYYYDEMPSVNLKGDNQVVKDFKLSRACIIEVQVVDEANQPVENAEISVNSLGDEIITKRIGSDMLRRKTDKEGFCLVGGIPPKTA